MTKIIDEDVIRQKPVSDAYRDGWERCFGDAPHAEPADRCSDAIECTIRSYANYQAPVAIATIEPVEAVATDPHAFEECDGHYVDFQGLRRPCTTTEGCGYHGCESLIPSTAIYPE